MKGSILGNIARCCLFLRVAATFTLVATTFQAAAGQSAVASAHPLATDAGIEILQKGGNAFDAAIAVTAVIAVVQPYSSGIGGGGFWLLHVANDKRDVMIDGRERAPLAATRDMYLDDAGKVVPGASVNGPLSAGIPGVPAAIDHLARNYGRLPLTETMSAAIKYAREGFITDEHYQRMASIREIPLNASKDAARIFLVDNKAPEPGTRIVQTELAHTLELIATRGANGFYKGETADKLLRSMEANGGIWQQRDFDEYRVIERQPIVGEYRGMKIISAPPPSSGGIAMVQMFNMLSGFDFESMSEISRIHLLTEVMRRAYRDRAEYLGDSDYVDVPVERLLSSEHAKEMAATITLDEATPSEALPAVMVDNNKAMDTTHFSIIDKFGNRVSATLSINYPFGSCFVAEGTGVLLNDEMDDFSAKPGAPNVYGLVGAEANAIAPGKRMLSSMSPTFLETEDRLAVVGTPGGSRIITMVMLAALDFYLGNTADSMVNKDRFHHQYLPDQLFHEPNTLSDSVLTTLFEMGHEVKGLDGTYGDMHVLVEHKQTGKIDAASDKRGVGKARVMQ